MDPFDQYADEIVGRAWEAGEKFRQFTQEQVDRIVTAVFEAAYDARLELARLAHEETGMGLYEHKVIKNAWASLLVYEDIRDKKTVGMIAHDPSTGITEIAQPKGVILATIPVTNPTSTTIFKVLICLKTRNPLILSPHRAARKSIRRTGRDPGRGGLSGRRAHRFDPVDHQGRERVLRADDASPQARAHPGHGHERDRPQGAGGGEARAGRGARERPRLCIRDPPIFSSPRSRSYIRRPSTTGPSVRASRRS